MRNAGRLTGKGNWEMRMALIDSRQHLWTLVRRVNVASRDTRKGGEQHFDKDVVTLCVYDEQTLHASSVVNLIKFR